MINITSIVSSDIPEVLHGDPAIVARIITNIVGNSVKFTENGRIDVSAKLFDQITEKHELAIVFEVRDTGIGIRHENLHRIFNLFEREDGSLTAKHGGTGLGLTIAKRLIETLGGSITVESSHGVGTCFKFTIKMDIALLQHER